MKILSIRAPWWWHILYDRKDIENRDWDCSYTGPLLIHASRWWQADDVADDYEAAFTMTNRKPAPLTTELRDEMRRGGGHIVGLVEMTGCDCVMDYDSEKRPHPSPWFVGTYGFRLKNPRALIEPIPFKARLGLIEAPPEIVEEVDSQIKYGMTRAKRAAMTEEECYL